jgi:hypothetical protein
MCSNASKLFLMHAGLVLVTTIPKVFSSGAPQHALVNSPSTPACRTRGCDSGAGGGVMLSGWGLRALPSKPSTQTLQPQFWTELASWCMGCLRTLGTLRALTATACPLECPPANRRTSWTRLRG